MDKIEMDLIDEQAELDLSFAEEEPMIHGSEIDASIRFLEDINNFSYMQPEDPFNNEAHIVFDILKVVH